MTTSGGAPPHRDDFEETVSIIECELDAVPDRTTPPPKLNEAEQAKFRAKAEALAPEYRRSFRSQPDR
jgi:hypothetical protein